MLACTHDLYFGTEYHASDAYSSRLTHINKDKDEQVWPPDVEAAFIQALETIPKLGRRKILVNGKPCGRNELISDFIFRKTGKLRTRKQVSSHIQVLKNTRKNDPHFMRLLTDASQENDMLMDPLFDQYNGNGLMFYPPAPPPPHPHYTLNQRQTPTDTTTISAAAAPITSTEMISGASVPSLSCSSSSTSSSDWMMYYDPSASMAPPLMNMSSSYYSTPPISSSCPSSAAMLPSHVNTNNIMSYAAFSSSTPSLYSPYGTISESSHLPPPPPSSSSSSSSPYHMQQQQQEHHLHPHHRQVFQDDSRNNHSSPVSSNQSTPNWANMCSPLTSSSSTPYFSLWPSYTGFYLENIRPTTVASDEHPLDATTTAGNDNKDTTEQVNTSSHMLSQRYHQDPHTLIVKNINALRLKCPWQDVQQLLTRLPPHCPFLLNQVSLDIQLGAISDTSVFQNTCLYQSREKRTLECITFVYSFGSLMLKTKETQLPQPDKLKDTFLSKKHSLSSLSSSSSSSAPSTLSSLSPSEEEATATVAAADCAQKQPNYTYNFTFINPFLDAFLKGIRSLPSWDEINIAIDQLCVLQVFEDMHTKEPLLAVLFDFQRNMPANITQQQQQQDELMQLTLLARPQFSFASSPTVKK